MHDYFRGNPEGRNPLEFLRDREPIRPEYRDRDARLAGDGRAGPRGVWLFPTLGMLYEELLKHDPEAVTHHVHGVQPLARRGLGLRLPGPDLRRAVPLARRRRLGGRELEWALDARRPHRRACAPPRRSTATGRARRSTRCSTRSGRASTRPGITVVVHAGDSGYSSQRLRGRRLQRRASRAAAGPSIKMLRHRARRSTTSSRRSSSTSSSSASRTCASRRSRTAPSSCPTCSASSRSIARKMPGYFPEDPVEIVPAARVDQPVLGGRRLRGRRAHGRRPRDLRLRLAPHRGHAAAARLRRRAQGVRRRRASAASCATTPAR